MTSIKPIHRHQSHRRYTIAPVLIIVPTRRIRHNKYTRLHEHGVLLTVNRLGCCSGPLSCASSLGALPGGPVAGLRPRGAHSAATLITAALRHCHVSTRMCRVFGVCAAYLLCSVRVCCVLEGPKVFGVVMIGVLCFGFFCDMVRSCFCVIFYYVGVFDGSLFLFISDFFVFFFYFSCI